MTLSWPCSFYRPLTQSDGSSSASLLWDAEWKTPQSNNDLWPLLQPTGAAGVPLGEWTASVQRGRKSFSPWTATAENTFFLLWLLNGILPFKHIHWPVTTKSMAPLDTKTVVRGNLSEHISFHFFNFTLKMISQVLDVREQTVFSLHSCFSSRKLACLRSGLQLDPAPKCTTALLRNTCEGCALILLNKQVEYMSAEKLLFFRNPVGAFLSFWTEILITFWMWKNCALIFYLYSITNVVFCRGSSGWCGETLWCRWNLLSWGRSWTSTSSDDLGISARPLATVPQRTPSLELCRWSLNNFARGYLGSIKWR